MVRTLTVDDLDWVVALLGRRREALVPHGPIFWRPAPDAATRHLAFFEHLLIEAGARGYRTEASVLVAARLGDGWLVDDAHVPGEDWSGDGAALWEALSDDCGGAPVRFVCPTYERARADFARSMGLVVSESWWLMELPGSGGGRAGDEVDLPGAVGVTVAAPPVYSPPGPVLYLHAPEDAARALPAAIEEAPGRGCAAIVVNQHAGDARLQAQLEQAGFRRHCDYFTGSL